MRGKIMCLLIAAILLAGVLPASGQEPQGQLRNCYLYDDFQSVYIGREPSYRFDGYWTSSTTSANRCGRIEVQNDAQKDSKVLKIHSTGNGKLTLNSYPAISLVGLFLQEDTVNIEFDFRTDDLLNTKGVLFRGNTASDVVKPLTITEGMLYADGGDGALMSVEPQRWYHCAIRFNTKDSIYDMYIDGEKVSTSRPGKVLDYSVPFELRFYVDGSEAKDVTNSLYLDNVKVYDADGFLPDEAFAAYVREADDSIYQTQEGWFPTREQITEDWKKTSNGVHPSVMLTPARVEEIKQAVQNDPVAKKSLETLRQKGDLILTQPLPTYTKNDGQRLDAANPILDDVETLAMLYQVTGETKYAQRAYDELEAAANFPDWGINVYLLVGTLSAATAIGYDWLYDFLTPQQRQVLVDALQKHSFRHALNTYHAQPPLDSTDTQTWYRIKNNWAVVCGGGTAMAAMAVFDALPEVCAEILEYSLPCIDNYLSLFAPDGGYMEGTLYWGYSTYYFTRMLAAMETSLGTDYGRYDEPGVSKTAYFPIYMQSDVAAFDFSDSNLIINRNADMQYYARRNGDTSLGSIRRNALEAGLETATMYDLLWYDPSFDGNVSALAKDYYFGEVETGSLRAAFNDTDSLFIGFHAGKNGVSHSHTDNGTFVLDALGTRWFMDLGKEQFSYDIRMAGVTGYYRHRAEGHNCIVMNPDEGNGQIDTAFAPVTDFKSTPEEAYAIVDLTSSYSPTSTRVTRGYKLTQNRTRAVIQDKVVNKRPADYWWFAHTAAKVRLSADKRSAVLERDNKKLLVYLQSDDKNIRFSLMEAKAFRGSPHPSMETSNDGISKLAIHVEDATELEYAVNFVPLREGDSSAAYMGEYVPIDQWATHEAKFTPMAKLDDILLDGEPLEGFDPDRFAYTAYLDFGDPTPQVQALSDKQVQITESDGYPPKYDITVQKPGKPSGRGYYSVSFVMAPKRDLPEGEELRPVSVKASDYQIENGVHYTPQNTIDGNEEDASRWSALGEQWIEYDFGETIPLKYVALKFMNNTQRRSLFDVEVSEDGVSYHKIYNGNSSGGYAGFETFAVKPAQARYVRLNCHGNSSSDWNSLIEAKFFK